MRTCLLAALTAASYLTVLAAAARASGRGKIVDQYIKAAGGSKALAKTQT